MRLRTRISDTLKDRLKLKLPEALETTWDAVGVAVMVEQLKFKSAGGFEGAWQRCATFEGFVRAELRGDDIDALPVEPLIADLASEPMFLGLEEGTPEGQLSEEARVILAEWRDTIRDHDVASSLRFSIVGTLAVHAGPDSQPDVVLVPSGAQPPFEALSGGRA